MNFSIFFLDFCISLCPQDQGHIDFCQSLQYVSPQLLTSCLMNWEVKVKVNWLLKVIVIHQGQIYLIDCGHTLDTVFHQHICLDVIYTCTSNTPNAPQAIPSCSEVHDNTDKFMGLKTLFMNFFEFDECKCYSSFPSTHTSYC